jgi:hypothetical protein
MGLDLDDDSHHDHQKPQDTDGCRQHFEPPSPSKNIGERYILQRRYDVM